MIGDALKNIFANRPQPVIKATVRSRIDTARYQVTDDTGAVYAAPVSKTGLSLAVGDTVLLRSGAIIGRAPLTKQKIYEV